MAKSKDIELGGGEIVIPILYEDRSLLAVDKPAGWMLAPDSWDQTGRNLQLALQSSLNAGDFWARSRNLKFLRFIHRLDAETTGILLLAKSAGALRAYSEMFEQQRIEKYYLAVAHGVPKPSQWTCNLALTPDPAMKGRMKTVNPTPASGARAPHSALRTPHSPLKDAETHFRVLQTAKAKALIEAQPMTGRTHQIRAHLAAAGHPILGDPLYGPDEAAASKGRQRLALRACKLAFEDPFQRKRIRIEAPVSGFLREFGFDPK
ncbi:MAG TPA: RluA family pseudouridine synthase [Verrucomicrobiae bacterium]|nr:RluA family pseudouridine synthase [Verrucomicrobiae bacterium]